MKKIIIANWKMQLSYQESLTLIKKFVKKITVKDRLVVICPSYLPLSRIVAVSQKTKLEIGAQDCTFVNQGAYTGEVSPKNLKDIGVGYVIIGHSERRQYLKENLIINKKLKAALSNNLIPILCIGEDMATRKKGQTKRFLSQQLQSALRGIKIKLAQDIIIAYEPLWVIGSGRAIVPAEAESIQAFIKEEARRLITKNVRIIYGGSVDDQNAEEFLKQKNIAGLLIGGASLDVNKFSKIC